MAPNVISDSSDTTPFKEPQDDEKQRKEIFYNGYFYDITDFISRHPGGNIIKFYTEPGEDATQAIDQFHFRSKKRVDAIMSSFKKRLAEPNERGLASNALSRHEALSKDFNILFEELVSEGYFEPSIPHVILRLLDAIALTFLSWGIFFKMTTWWGTFLSVMFVGFVNTRYGWLQHETGHVSLTGAPRVDKYLQTIFTCLCTGSSAIWWNSQHNRHHAMPQRVQHDVDLATLPFVAFNVKTVKDRKEINSFFVRYQAVLYWTIDLFIVLFAWKIVLHPRYQIKKKAYLELFCTLLNNSIVLYYVGPIYFLALFWDLFFLGVSFALSHSHLDVAEKPTHWIEYSLTHTANISSNMFVDYWMGYLNYQIEHHLFPNMPQFRQMEIGHRVRALAEKHGLPYRVYSYPEACRLAFKNLNDVGKELTKEDHLHAG